MANTITTLRPDGVSFNTIWTNQGGAASINAATSDNLDATFAQAPAFPGSSADTRLLLTMGTFSIPALAQVRSVTVRARARYDSSLNFQWGYSSGGVIVSDSTNFAQDGLIHAVTGTPRPTRPDGAAWAQADIDGLMFWSAVDRNLSDYVCNIYEAYIDVAYNQAPVVSAITPSGLISITNQPTIGWTFTDPEGDAQESFVVKIFDAATIAAPGFNPETSTPVLSATVFSPTPSWNVSAPLASGVTYTAYVKAADVGSSSRYSLWASGSTFSIAASSGLLFDPPAIPSVTSATPDSVNNRVAVLLQGADNELTRNQSSVETGLAGWEVGANVAIARDTTAGSFLHGVAGLKMTSVASGDMNVRSLTGALAGATAGYQMALVPVLGSKTYEALASFKSAVSVRSCRVDIRWFTSAGAFISATTGSAANDNTSTWTQVVCASTAPSNAAYAGLVLSVLATGAASEVHWVDQIGLAPGASTTWTRGGFVQPIGAVIDSFTRVDSASTMGNSEGTLTPAWAAVVGTWGIQTGRAYLVSSTAKAMAMLATQVLADGVISVDLTTSPTTGRTYAGLVFRATDQNNCLYVDISKTSGQNVIELWKIVGGTANLLSSAAANLADGTTYGLKVEFFGGRIQAYIDRKDGLGYIKLIDFTLVAADIASLGTAANTRVGLHVDLVGGSDDGGSRFDNFSATNIGTQVALAERSVDGGVTWSQVRSINGVALADPGQFSTVYDYEAPRGVAIQYRARARATESTLTFLSAYSGTVAMSPNLASDGQSWLKSPTDPTKNAPINLLQNGADSKSTEDLAIYAPLGRADYLIHGGTVRTEVFDGLDILCLNDAAWAAWEVLRRRQEVLLLQTCYGDTTPEEFWIRLGPDRAVSRLTMSTSPGQIRRVKIQARQVIVPAVT